ncbi:hypothetical protein T05_624 [Trichinella murrelli]|uniref:Uncharacterized protein n=1 Tax=Trichinella murrelli TaxID=144512 RepID=A0A0V0U2Y1_9BILA|nr:hypothetical protein T05_624 [Trichinella murrelli]
MTINTVPAPLHNKKTVQLMVSVKRPIRYHSSISTRTDRMRQLARLLSTSSIGSVTSRCTSIV